MPRMSKKDKEEMAFYINPDTGRITYNDKCKKCVKECKQSYRATIVQCTQYESKRAVKSGA